MGRLIDLWHPQEVWLFGSRARGDARPGSDWDLLVVVPDEASDDLLDMNAAWLKLRDLKIPVDLFPMRRRDFDEQRCYFGSLAQIATSEGERIDAR